MPLQPLVELSSQWRRQQWQKSSDAPLSYIRDKLYPVKLIVRVELESEGRVAIEVFEVGMCIPQ